MKKNNYEDKNSKNISMLRLYSLSSRVTRKKERERERAEKNE